MERWGIEHLTLFADQAADRARRDVVATSGDEAFELLTIHLDLFDDTVAEFSGALNGIISRLASGFLTDYIGGVRTALPGSVLLCELLFLQTSAFQAWIE